MVTARRPIYKPNIPELMDDCITAENNGRTHYRNHLFDIPDVTKSRKRNRRKDISHGLAPLKGVKPVRDKGRYRIDESTISPQLLPPIPQTKINTDIS